MRRITAKWAWYCLALTAVWMLGACHDLVTGPDAKMRQNRRADLTISVAPFEHAGEVREGFGVAGTVVIGGVAGNERVLSQGHATPLDVREFDQARLAAHGLVLGFQPGTAPSAGRSGSQRGRTRLRLPKQAQRYADITAKDADGKSVRVSFVGEPATGGRRVGALVVYVDHTLRAINQIRRDPETGRPIAVHATSFDAAGRPGLAYDVDLSDLTAPSEPTRIGAILQGITEGCGQLVGVLRPRPLNAAQVIDCSSEEANFAAAIFTQTAAEVTLASLLASCGFTAGATCVGAGAAALALAGATAWAVAAAEAVTECYSGATQQGGAYEGQTGGGGGEDLTAGAGGCYTAVLEISYDGGVSWEYYATLSICEA